MTPNSLGDPLIPPKPEFQPNPDPCRCVNDDSDTVCEECCEHSDGYECGHCIECGKNCSEDLYAQAYDRMKDARKYGDT